MTLNSSHEELERILRLLSDRAALQERGADDMWIDRCCRLVEEFRALQKRVAELETRLNEHESGSQQDTAIL
jgi:hypothetical protein